MNLGCVVELGEAGLELSLPASGHHKLWQDGDVAVRAPAHVDFNRNIDLKMSLRG